MENMEKNDIYLRALLDYRCGVNHLRILYYAINTDIFTIYDVIKFFKYTQPYANRIINQLVSYEYLKVASRDVLTGRINYKKGE